MYTLSSGLEQPQSFTLKPFVPLKVVVMGDSLIYGYGDPEGVVGSIVYGDKD